MLKRALLVIFLAGLFSSAWGQDFGLDAGCCSEPLSSQPISVDATGGGTFGFFNSLDTQITELSFIVHVASNFNAEGLQCKAFEFFNCTSSFDSEADVVHIEFIAPNAPETGDGVDGGPFSTDQELGPTELEGIPTLLAGCGIGQANPDTGTSLVTVGETPLPCDYKGHFQISFNDFGGSPSDPTFNDAANGSGGWKGAVASINTINGLPAPVPEPAAVLGAVLLIVGLTRRQRRRTA